MWGGERGGCYSRDPAQEKVSVARRGQQHLGLGVDMLAGVTSSQLQHTHTLRRIGIAPQLADSQALLVNMEACQSACSPERKPSAMGSTAQMYASVNRYGVVFSFHPLPTELENGQGVRQQKMQAGRNHDSCQLQLWHHVT